MNDDTPVPLEFARAQRQVQELELELARKTEQLEEALETLQAIRGGQVDALVVHAGAEGERVFTLEGADRPYRVIVETMNEAAATVTSEGLILYANQRLATLLRTPLPDIAGQRLSRFVPQRFRRTMSRLLARSRTGRMRRRLLLAATDGAEIPVYVSTSSQKDPDSGRETICLVITDLTKLEASAARLRQANIRQQALAASEHYWRQMAEAVPQLIWTAQADGHVDYCNRRWIDNTGASLERTRLDGWLASVEPRDRARAAGAWTRALQGGRDFHVEVRLRQSDGQPRWFLVRVAPLSDERGNVFKWLGTCTDIDDRRRAEEALRSINEELEERVAERTAEANRRASQLRALAAELTNAEQRERQRMGQMLHDGLQQLLVAAKYGVETLRLHGSGSALEPRIGHLDELLTESLNASRNLTIELSPPVLLEGDFPSVLNWLGRWMRDKHGLEVAFGLEEGADLQERDLRILVFQAVRELLFNVAKHAGVQRAEVEMGAADESHVRISVTDRGGGFDPGLPEHAGGSTFGLFSIRERLELLGGQLRIASAPGEGTRVDMLVPRRVRRPEADGEVAASPTPSFALPRPDDEAETNGRRLRVVLADDHEIVRQGILGLLRDEPDIEIVAEASNGREALELARALRPDVVIMDISMPVLDGIEATRRLTRELPEIRVIGLSMHAQADMAEQMRQAGARGYVTKGGPSEVLLAAVRGQRK